MRSGNRLAWGFLPSADPRGRACRPDRASAARESRLLGERKPKLPAGQPPGTGPQTFRPRSSSTGTAVSWHAYASMRTRTRLMNLPCHYSQAKSSVHRPGPSGRAWMPGLLVSLPTPRPRRLIPRGAGAPHPDRFGGGEVRAGERAGRSVYRPNGLAVSFRRRQPVTVVGFATGCRSRSRTPPAARPRRNPGRRRSSPTRRSCRAGRPTSGRRRSARPGCSGTPACRYRPG